MMKRKINKKLAYKHDVWYFFLRKKKFFGDFFFVSTVSTVTTVTTVTTVISVITVTIVTTVTTVTAVTTLGRYLGVRF